MSLSAIIMLVVGLVSAIGGALVMRPIAKSSGRKEGEQQAQAQQASAQNEKAAQAAQERTHVEVEIAADTDDALDRRLQKHDRLS